METPTGFPTSSQVAHYTAARIQHFLHGEPVCTQEEILARLAICKVCPNYDKQKQLCLLCECYVNAGTKRNKLAWADSECPDMPPRWPALYPLEKLVAWQKAIEELQGDAR